uniref:la-related protein 6B n=1 Tax=Erigeron canadensis TaxID=72917 RepID=UPI001CB909C7|nr:la-related protein 6B [Erigeron canadensis]
MAQEPSISSSNETLESPTVTSSDNTQLLTRNVSFSRLNAKAPEFVPRTTAAVVSPPPSVISPGAGDLIHVYPPPPPPPNPPFHVPIPVNVPVTVPVHHHHHHHGHHHHHHGHHGQHYVPVQYHHHNQNQNHNHHRPFNGGGGGGGGTGSIDQKEVVAQAPRIEPELKDGLTDEATQKIVNQVEYYFSDINLATTDHLMRFIHKDPEGYVPISVVVSFKKIKALVSGNAQLASILRNSTKLVVSEDGKKVKRQHPMTESDMEELQSRIIIAENLPEDHCHQNLMKIFSAVGSVKTIRTCQPQTSNGGPSSGSKAAKAEGMLFSNKLHAFVEYESIELAEKAALELNKEASWRNGLKVRLMRRPSKHAQARGKKSGQEEEAIHKEDDTSTSEQHPLNDKHLDDTIPQSDVQSHEHVVEDHSNEKEAGHKKGRNRSRGKGRGRPQYNHHNNRGNHVVAPLSTNSVNTEHPVIGKQPPGPRMPDGTRGFSMGRGKPITVSVDSRVS